MALDSEEWVAGNMNREGKDGDFSLDFTRSFLVRGSSLCKVRDIKATDLFFQGISDISSRGEPRLGKRNAQVMKS